jgi:hypothetical protein
MKITIAKSMVLEGGHTFAGFLKNDLNHYFYERRSSESKYEVMDSRDYPVNRKPLLCFVERLQKV